MQKCVNKKCPAYNTDYVYDCELNAVIADGNCKEYQPDAPQEIVEAVVKAFVAEFDVKKNEKQNISRPSRKTQKI